MFVVGSQCFKSLQYPLTVLWNRGNATVCLRGLLFSRCHLTEFVSQDLSMLTHLSHDDIQHLQTVGKDAQAARAEYILCDDQEKVWNHLKSLDRKQDSRVDFVLDNGVS